MSSQDQSSSFKLNPSAAEFVPNFSFASAATTSGSSGPVGSGNNYNNGYHNNQPYSQRNNNYQQNNYGQNNRYNNRNNHNNYYNPNQNQYNNRNDEFDAVEIEARCEAVVEILQDEKIRDQLNHVSNKPQPEQQENGRSDMSRQNSRNQNGRPDEEAEPQFDDEEEMLEMLEMQEECRLEMMKFYIQSQNPSLFEEIYHDVSYPDAKPPSPPRERAPRKNADGKPEPTDASTDNVNTLSDVKDLIVNNLNPDVDDFVPNKFADLSLEGKK